MNIAVIFAGGVGTRMRSKDKPKQFLIVHGKPIIVHTLEVFQSHPDIDGIVIACVEEWIPHMRELISHYGLDKVGAIVPGGATGQLSIYEGLKAAAATYGRQNVIALVHDGVRPLIDERIVAANIESVKKTGSAVTCSKATETVLLTDEHGTVVSIPDRSSIRLAKAPQSFWLDDLLKAHEWAAEQGKSDYIDSASLMRERGCEISLVEGWERNIKITTQSDYFSMRAILDAGENAQLYGEDE